MGKQIVIATKNKNKANEFTEMFKKRNIEVKTLLDYSDIPEIVEDGNSFEENAKKKSHTLAEALGEYVLADDSGLMIDALHGNPGIHSARYASDHNDAANNAKVLAELGNVPDENRTAKFVSTLVLTNPQDFDQDLVVRGELTGKIAKIPRGDNGFGYDPLFYLPEKDKTLAELSMEEKNEISHRAIAIKKLEKNIDNWVE